MKFQRFKRGNVVMVEFSPSMGSEIKGKHLAAYDGKMVRV